MGSKPTLLPKLKTLGMLFSAMSLIFKKPNITHFDASTVQSLNSRLVCTLGVRAQKKLEVFPAEPHRAAEILVEDARGSVACEK